jgi:predicted nucleic acid-binding protein
VTLYLLDANVLREFRPRGHRNVRNWLATVDDAALRVSVMTLLEMRRGWEAKKQHDPAHAAEGLERLFAFETAFKDRIIPIDARIAAEWARLIGQKDKHRDDMALAATARVRRLVLVTRNLADFRGRGVRVVDPFKAKPEVLLI